MNERIAELLQNRQQIQEEADLAYTAFKSAKDTLKEIDERLIAEMKADGASKLLTNDGSIYRIAPKTERTFNDDGMLTLAAIVPEKMFNKAHEVETVHKWRWAGIKDLLTLGGDVKKIIEANMVVDVVEKLEIKKAKEAKVDGISESAA